MGFIKGTYSHPIIVESLQYPFKIAVFKGRSYVFKAFRLHQAWNYPPYFWRTQPHFWCDFFIIFSIICHDTAFHSELDINTVDLVIAYLETLSLSKRCRNLLIASWTTSMRKSSVPGFKSPNEISLRSGSSRSRSQSKPISTRATPRTRKKLK